MTPTEHRPDRPDPDAAPVEDPLLVSDPVLSDRGLSDRGLDDPVLEDEDLPPVVPVGERRERSGVRIAVLVLVLVAALGFLVSKGLGEATVYFRTADQAIAQRSQLGTRRFRLEGTVMPNTLKDFGNGELRFSVLGEQGTRVDVVHRGGQPTGVFTEAIPVVMEGKFQSNSVLFLSDRIIVKHSESYRAENPDRVKDYGSDGSVK